MDKTDIALAIGSYLCWLVLAGAAVFLWLQLMARRVERRRRGY